MSKVTLHTPGMVSIYISYIRHLILIALLKICVYMHIKYFNNLPSLPLRMNCCSEPPKQEFI